MLARLIQKIRFLKAFFAVVRDPTRTDQIFVVITDPRIVNKNSFDAVFAKLRESQKIIELMDQRYAGKWNLDELLTLPVDSLGYIYAKHMRDNGLAIDFYPAVRGESIHAYIQMRSRQTHDIWHIMTGFDTSVAGEAGLQAFVQAQMYARSPSLIMTMFMLHSCFYNPSDVIEVTAAIARGWSMGIAAEPLFGEKFEENWHRNLEDYRRDLKLVLPIDHRSRGLEVGISQAIADEHGLRSSLNL
jgi:ubiquinone biosynthesis protein COQ4